MTELKPEIWYKITNTLQLSVFFEMLRKQYNTDNVEYVSKYHIPRNEITYLFFRVIGNGVFVHYTVQNKVNGPSVDFTEIYHNYFVANSSINAQYDKMSKINNEVKTDMKLNKRVDDLISDWSHKCKIAISEEMTIAAKKYLTKQPLYKELQELEKKYDTVIIDTIGGDIFLSPEQHRELNDLKQEYYKQEEEHNKRVEELKSLLTITDTFEQAQTLLKQYGVIE